MKSINLKEAAKLASILEENRWVLVKFSAIWCEPCQLLAPIFDRLDQQHPELQTVCVNIDAHPELTKNYAVRSVPTLLLFKQGEIIDQVFGLHSEIQINTWLTQQLGSDQPKGESS